MTKKFNPAVKAWLRQFGAALRAKDPAGVTALFDDDCYWRDLVSFTWNITTQEGKPAIAEMLEVTLKQTRPTKLALEGDAAHADGITEGWFTFETKHARGRGHIRLRDGLCWTLLTTMVELKGHEEAKGATRPMGVEHGIVPGRESWLENREREQQSLGYSEQPYCLIIGGGQGGIALGARLKKLGVPTIIVEKNPKPGDSWRRRYKSLCLHDPVWYDHLPYLPFPENWPVFSPKDKLGDWLEMYTRVMELDYWGDTECRQAQYNAKKKEWTVVVDRNGAQVTLRPKQLVLATGMSGLPNIPDFPGRGQFPGEQLHSSQFGSGEDYNDRRCVVIGSNNSAHDICASLWEHGADVTMVQRSSTHIARSDTLMELALGALYSEQALANGITTDKADLIFASIPYRVLPATQIPVYEQMADRDKSLYDRLEKAGFMLDFGEDGSGLFCKYLRRGSGYYIDVGAAELIADGKVQLKSGVQVESITAVGVRLSDGTELPADAIIYATGYGSMNGWAAQIISQEVADKVGKCWGMGSGTSKDPGPWEGELRNMWKPTQQDGLWFHGGNLHQSRHYSQFLSLQIKARQEKLPVQVYGLPAVHHLQ